MSLTQRQFAAALGVAFVTLNRWERMLPQPRLRFLLADDAGAGLVRATQERRIAAVGARGLSDR
jgi:transcriptional regulator with XRE-family HTH domain